MVIFETNRVKVCYGVTHDPANSMTLEYWSVEDKEQFIYFTTGVKPDLDEQVLIADLVAYQQMQQEELQADTVYKFK